MTDIKGQLAKTEKKVDHFLHELLGTEGDKICGERPKLLYDAMKHGSLNGGKRFRPHLVFETGKLFGVSDELLIHAACAVECIHCYSLIHDDLPAMDDDDLRRGIPTVHKAYDEALAILAGDGLLTLAFDILSDEKFSLKPELKITLIKALSHASGPMGMVGGQVLDLYPEPDEGNLNRVSLMQSMKTGALIRFSCEAGAICGQANADDQKSLRTYGELIGHAFQLADDILDVTATSAQMGKETDKDQDRGKVNQVSILGLKKAQALAEELIQNAIQCLTKLPGDTTHLEEIAYFVIRREN